MAAVFRAAFGYCFLIFMVRIVGRRPGRQMTPFEYVLIFFLGGLTLTAMVADDRSLTNALCTIITIAITNIAITLLKKRSPAFGRVIDGTPLILLSKGQWQMESMRKMRIADDDVMAAGRDKGLEQLDRIDYAVLERNSEISIVQKSEG